jgi:hypothetical protein
MFFKSWLGCVEVGFIRLWVGNGMQNLEFDIV